MKRIAINENGIHMVFEVRRDKVRLVHFSALPLDENTLVRQGEKDLYFPSEIQVTGRNRPSNWHGAKIVETSPGYESIWISATAGMTPAASWNGRPFTRKPDCI